MPPSPELFEAHELAQDMLDDLPPFLRDDPDIRAVIYCQAREHERKQEFIDRVQANVVPQTADEMGLPWWERLLGITPTEGQSVEGRQETVLAFLQGLHAAGTGAWWESTITRGLGPGWSYEENVPGELIPPAGTVRVTLPFDVGSLSFLRAKQLVRRVTDSHIALEFVAADSLLFDQGLFDQDRFQ